MNSASVRLQAFSISTHGACLAKVVFLIKCALVGGIFHAHQRRPAGLLLLLVLLSLWILVFWLKNRKFIHMHQEADFVLALRKLRQICLI